MSIHQHSQHALPSASAACWPVPKTTRPRCERSQLHFAWDVLLRFTQVGCLDDVICRNARRLVESNEFISAACSVLSLPSTRLCCAFSSLLPFFCSILLISLPISLSSYPLNQPLNCPSASPSACSTTHLTAHPVTHLVSSPLVYTIHTFYPLVKPLFLTLRQFVLQLTLISFTLFEQGTYV